MWSRRIQVNLRLRQGFEKIALGRVGWEKAIFENGKSFIIIFQDTDLHPLPNLTVGQNMNLYYLCDES